MEASAADSSRARAVAGWPGYFWMRVAQVVAPGWVARRRLDSVRAFSDFEICHRRTAVPAQRRITIGTMVLGLSQAGAWAGRI